MHSTRPPRWPRRASVRPFLSGRGCRFPEPGGLGGRGRCELLRVGGCWRNGSHRGPRCSSRHHPQVPEGRATAAGATQNPGGLTGQRAGTAQVTRAGASPWVPFLPAGRHRGPDSGCRSRAVVLQLQRAQRQRSLPQLPPQVRAGRSEGSRKRRGQWGLRSLESRVEKQLHETR